MKAECDQQGTVGGGGEGGAVAGAGAWQWQFDSLISWSLAN